MVDSLNLLLRRHCPAHASIFRYHYSVEYFEDLRNIDHCELIVMRRNEAGKYTLENKLRTWTELKAEQEALAAANPHAALKRSNTEKRFLEGRRRWQNWGCAG